jgi:2-amino-4-hydroxy-6-hydroxymethyldihydropteridine diphosphokinase
MAHLYVLALGSNRGARHGRTPKAMLAAAMAALKDIGLEVLAQSPVFDTLPLGPARRRFANAAAVVRSSSAPPELLKQVKALERALGRRPVQRWGNRAIDIDIILWSGGLWHDRTLSIPHPAWRTRRFVVDPLVSIVPDWRDPVTGLSVRQTSLRLRR